MASILTALKNGVLFRPGLWRSGLIISGAILAGAGLVLGAREGSLGVLGMRLMLLGAFLNVIVALLRNCKRIPNEGFSLPMSRVLISLAAGAAIGSTVVYFWAR